MWLRSRQFFGAVRTQGVPDVRCRFEDDLFNLGNRIFDHSPLRLGVAIRHITVGVIEQAFHQMWRKGRMVLSDLAEGAPNVVLGDARKPCLVRQPLQQIIRIDVVASL